MQWMDKRRKEPQRGETTAVGDILPRLIKGISKKAGGFLPLIATKWKEIVGEQVANHTTPASLTGTKLIIEVDDSVWMAELARFHKRRIIDAINHDLEGKITDEISFRPKRKS